MNVRFPIILVLALVGCGDLFPTGSTESDEVLALSEAAVEEAVEQVEEVDTAPSSDVITLSVEMKSDAVPMGSVVVETEPVVESYAEEIPTATFKLRHGETLAHYARWSELPVEVIAETSDLDLGGSYPVGTEVKVPVEEQTLGMIEVRREEHRQVRVDGYLASRGGATSTDFYTVRTGDTAWGISRTGFGIPVWVLEAYNPSVPLDTLRPGQELMVPVLADTVVDAE